LNTLVDDLAANDRVRVVVLRGAGRAFCSGIDVTALSRGETGMGFFRNWETALRKLETMDAVVIAAVHSHCIGGGLQIALACDLRVARDDARFGITAVREGILPGIGMWRVARYAGLGRAKRLALGADIIDAGTALEWGLVDWVVDGNSFEAKIAEVTSRLLSMAWTSTKLTKKLTNMAFDLSFTDFVATYFEYQQLSIASPEHRQAMADHRADRASR
jgi:enoyl-CoA hydratase/carnithine racemase